MKDRRTIAAILAAALTLTMCGVSAVAAEEADSSAAPDSSVSAQADQADSSAAVGGTPEDASSGDTAADSSQAGKAGEDQAAQDTHYLHNRSHGTRRAGITDSLAVQIHGNVCVEGCDKNPGNQAQNAKINHTAGNCASFSFFHPWSGFSLGNRQ